MLKAITATCVNCHADWVTTGHDMYKPYLCLPCLRHFGYVKMAPTNKGGWEPDANKD